jgi:hypothetical protein
MKQFKVAVISLLFATTARAADMVTTFHFNPSLDREANPWVSVLGADWTLLLVAQLAGLLAFVFIPLALYCRWPSKRLATRPRTAWEFASLCLYNQPMSKGKLIRAIALGWPLPRDWRQVLRLAGFSFPWAIGACSWMCVFSWWAINSWRFDRYQAFRSTLQVGGYPLVELLVAVLAFFMAIMVFFRLEYQHVAGGKAGDGWAKECT